MNLLVIGQALTGELIPSKDSPTSPPCEVENKNPLEEAIHQIFIGFGILAASLGVFFFMPAGRLWWFWLLIPAFVLLGKGIAMLASLKLGSGVTRPKQPLFQSKPAIKTNELPALPEPPPSVTESTTRLIDEAAVHPRRDDSVSQ
jgi:hypothetical protein